MLLRRLSAASFSQAADLAASEAEDYLKLFEFIWCSEGSYKLFPGTKVIICLGIKIIQGMIK
jgi:hypothetical protein